MPWAGHQPLNVPLLSQHFLAQQYYGNNNISNSDDNWYGNGDINTDYDMTTDGDGSRVITMTNGVVVRWLLLFWWWSCRKVMVKWWLYW